MAADILLTAELDLKRINAQLKKLETRKIDLFSGDAKKLNKFQQPLGRIVGTLGEFEKSLEASNARVIAFGASAGAIYGLQRAVSLAAKSFIEVESSLKEINVILGATTGNLKKFGVELFEVSKKTGMGFRDVAEAATELSRQGLGTIETIKRTTDALNLARLSGMDAKSAVEALTAAINSFSRAALTSTEITNKLANVDAKFAVSSQDLAEAIKRVASSAQSAGVSFDELVAAVTSAQQMTARGGNVIGNSLKTIFTRIQRPRVIKDLEKLGITVKDAGGVMLPTMKILSNMAIGFDKLGRAQKAQAAEMVGGVFQVNILKAVLSDLGKEFSVYGSALEASINSTDEAERRIAQLTKTFAGLLNETKANLTQLGAGLAGTTLEPAARKILESFNNVFTKGQKSQGIGTDIAKGMLKGIGTFLSGPGLAIGAVVFVKLFSKLTLFAKDAFKGIMGMNRAAAQQASTQKQIYSMMSKSPELLKSIMTGEKSVAQIHDVILDKIEAENLALEAQRKTVDILGRSGSIGSARETMGGRQMRAAKSRGDTGSHGFGGEQLKEYMGMQQGGYSKRAMKDPGIKKETLRDGSGSQKVYTNKHEQKLSFKNSQGKTVDMVVPEKGSGAHDKFMKNLTSSRGFVPNFASAKNRKTPLYDLDGTIIKEGFFKYNDPEAVLSITANDLMPLGRELRKKKEVIDIASARGAEDAPHIKKALTKLGLNVGKIMPLASMFKNRTETGKRGKPIKMRGPTKKRLIADKLNRNLVDNDPRNIEALGPRGIFYGGQSGGFIPNFAGKKQAPKKRMSKGVFENLSKSKQDAYINDATFGSHLERLDQNDPRVIKKLKEIKSGNAIGKGQTVLEYKDHKAVMLVPNEVKAGPGVSRKDLFASGTADDLIVKWPIASLKAPVAKKGGLAKFEDHFNAVTETHATKAAGAMRKQLGIKAKNSAPMDYKKELGQAGGASGAITAAAGAAFEIASRMALSFKDDKTDKAKAEKKKGDFDVLSHNMDQLAGHFKPKQAGALRAEIKINKGETSTTSMRNKILKNVYDTTKKGEIEKILTQRKSAAMGFIPNFVGGMGFGSPGGKPKRKKVETGYEKSRRKRRGIATNVGGEDFTRKEKYVGLSKKEATEEHQTLVMNAINWDKIAKEDGKPISKRQDKWIDTMVTAGPMDVAPKLGLTKGHLSKDRRTMPQMDKQQQKDFEADLASGNPNTVAGQIMLNKLNGYRSTGKNKDNVKKISIAKKGRKKVSQLIATQKDIYGDNVLGKLEGGFKVDKWYKQGPTKVPGWLGAPIMISKDNRILDGHHRWASVWARDIIDNNRMGGLSMKTNKINMPMTDLLQVAKPYSQGSASGSGTVVKKAAMGFIPNFARKEDIERAMIAEEMAGADPEYRSSPFPHVADKKTQKSFADVLKDHPNMPKAIEKSKQMQGMFGGFIPNFAGRAKEVLGGLGAGGADEDELGGVYDPDLGAGKDFFKSLGVQGGDLVDKITGWAKNLSGAEKTTKQIVDQLKKNKTAYKHAELAGDTAEMDRLNGAAEKLAQQYEGSIEREDAKEENDKKRTKFNKRYEKLSEKMLTASFVLPQAMGILSETLAKGSPKLQKGLNAISSGMSTGAAVMGMIPGPMGMVAGGAIALVTSFGGILKAFTDLGEKFGKAAEKAKEESTKFSDSSSKYLSAVESAEGAFKLDAEGRAKTAKEIEKIYKNLHKAIDELPSAYRAEIVAIDDLNAKREKVAEVMDKLAREADQSGLASTMAEKVNQQKGWSTNVDLDEMGWGNDTATVEEFTKQLSKAGGDRWTKLYEAMAEGKDTWKDPITGQETSLKGMGGRSGKDMIKRLESGDRNAINELLPLMRDNNVISEHQFQVLDTISDQHKVLNKHGDSTVQNLLKLTKAEKETKDDTDILKKMQMDTAKTRAKIIEQVNYSKEQVKILRQQLMATMNFSKTFANSVREGQRDVAFQKARGAVDVGGMFLSEGRKRDYQFGINEQEIDVKAQRKAYFGSAKTFNDTVSTMMKKLESKAKVTIGRGAEATSDTEQGKAYADYIDEIQQLHQAVPSKDLNTNFGIFNDKLIKMVDGFDELEETLKSELKQSVFNAQEKERQALAEVERTRREQRQLSIWKRQVADLKQMYGDMHKAFGGIEAYMTSGGTESDAFYRTNQDKAQERNQKLADMARAAGRPTIEQMRASQVEVSGRGSKLGAFQSKDFSEDMARAQLGVVAEMRRMYGASFDDKTDLSRMMQSIQGTLTGTYKDQIADQVQILSDMASSVTGAEELLEFVKGQDPAAIAKIQTEAFLKKQTLPESMQKLVTNLGELNQNLDLKRLSDAFKSGIDNSERMREMSNAYKDMRRILTNQQNFYLDYNEGIKEAIGKAYKGMGSGTGKPHRDAYSAALSSTVGGYSGRWDKMDRVKQHNPLAGTGALATSLRSSSEDSADFLRSLDQKASGRSLAVKDYYVREKMDELTQAITGTGKHGNKRKDSPGGLAKEGGLISGIGRILAGIEQYIASGSGFGSMGGMDLGKALNSAVLKGAGTLKAGIENMAKDFKAGYRGQTYQGAGSYEGRMFGAGTGKEVGRMAKFGEATSKAIKDLKIKFNEGVVIGKEIRDLKTHAQEYQKTMGKTSEAGPARTTELNRAAKGPTRWLGKIFGKSGTLSKFLEPKTAKPAGAMSRFLKGLRTGQGPKISQMMLPGAAPYELPGGAAQQRGANLHKSIKELSKSIAKAGEGISRSASSIAGIPKQMIQSGFGTESGAIRTAGGDVMRRSFFDRVRGQGGTIGYAAPPQTTLGPVVDTSALPKGSVAGQQRAAYKEAIKEGKAPGKEARQWAKNKLSQPAKLLPTDMYGRTILGPAPGSTPVTPKVAKPSEFMKSYRHDIARAKTPIGPLMEGAHQPGTGFKGGMGKVAAKLQRAIGFTTGLGEGNWSQRLNQWGGDKSAWRSVGPKGSGGFEGGSRNAYGAIYDKVKGWGSSGASAAGRAPGNVKGFFSAEGGLSKVINPIRRAQGAGDWRTGMVNAKGNALTQGLASGGVRIGAGFGGDWLGRKAVKSLGGGETAQALGGTAGALGLTAKLASAPAAAGLATFMASTYAGKKMEEQGLKGMETVSYAAGGAGSVATEAAIVRSMGLSRGLTGAGGMGLGGAAGIATAVKVGMDLYVEGQKIEATFGQEEETQKALSEFQQRYINVPKQREKSYQMFERGEGTFPRMGGGGRRSAQEFRQNYINAMSKPQEQGGFGKEFFSKGKDVVFQLYEQRIKQAKKLGKSEEEINKLLKKQEESRGIGQVGAARALSIEQQKLSDAQQQYNKSLAQWSKFKTRTGASSRGNQVEFFEESIMSEGSGDVARAFGGGELLTDRIKAEEQASPWKKKLRKWSNPGNMIASKVGQWIGGNSEYDMQMALMENLETAMGAEGIGASVAEAFGGPLNAIAKLPRNLLRSNPFADTNMWQQGGINSNVQKYRKWGKFRETEEIGAIKGDATPTAFFSKYLQSEMADFKWHVQGAGNGLIELTENGDRFIISSKATVKQLDEFQKFLQLTVSGAGANISKKWKGESGSISTSAERAGMITGMTGNIVRGVGDSVSAHEKLKGITASLLADWINVQTVKLEVNKNIETVGQYGSLSASMREDIFRDAATQRLMKLTPEEMAKKEEAIYAGELKAGRGPKMSREIAKLSMDSIRDAGGVLRSQDIRKSKSYMGVSSQLKDEKAQGAWTTASVSMLMKAREMFSKGEVRNAQMTGGMMDEYPATPGRWGGGTRYASAPDELMKIITADLGKAGKNADVQEAIEAFWQNVINELVQKGRDPTTGRLHETAIREKELDSRVKGQAKKSQQAFQEGNEAWMHNMVRRMGSSPAFMEQGRTSKEKALIGVTTGFERYSGKETIRDKSGNPLTEAYERKEKSLWLERGGPAQTIDAEKGRQMRMNQAGQIQYRTNAPGMNLEADAGWKNYKDKQKEGALGFSGYETGRRRGGLSRDQMDELRKEGIDTSTIGSDRNVFDASKLNVQAIAAEASQSKGMVSSQLQSSLVKTGQVAYSKDGQRIYNPQDLQGVTGYYGTPVGIGQFKDPPRPSSTGASSPSLGGGGMGGMLVGKGGGKPSGGMGSMGGPVAPPRKAPLDFSAIAAGANASRGGTGLSEFGQGQLFEGYDVVAIDPKNINPSADGEYYSSSRVPKGEMIVHMGQGLYVYNPQDLIAAGLSTTDKKTGAVKAKGKVAMGHGYASTTTLGKQGMEVGQKKGMYQGTSYRERYLKLSGGRGWGADERELERTELEKLQDAESYMQGLRKSGGAMTYGDASRKGLLKGDALLQNQGARRPGDLMLNDEQKRIYGQLIGDAERGLGSQYGGFDDQRKARIKELKGKGMGGGGGLGGLLGGGLGLEAMAGLGESISGLGEQLGEGGLLRSNLTSLSEQLSAEAPLRQNLALIAEDMGAINAALGLTSEKFNEYFTLIDEAASVFGTNLGALKQRLEVVAAKAGVAPQAPSIGGP